MKVKIIKWCKKFKYDFFAYDHEDWHLSFVTSQGVKQNYESVSLIKDL